MELARSAAAAALVVVLVATASDRRKSEPISEQPGPGARMDGVPADVWPEVSAFKRSVSYDPATETLSARTEGERTNFLALNLADEVLRGKRSASNARDLYDAVLNFSLDGKNSPYMSGLLFER